MKRDSRYFPKLIQNLILHFVAVIVVMVGICAYSMYWYSSYFQNYYLLFKQLDETQSISLSMDNLYTCLENYGHSGHADYLAEYQSGYNNLHDMLFRLKVENYHNELYLYYKNLKNMLTTFGEKSDALIKDYNNQISSIYINQSIAELSRLNNYMQNENKKLLMSQLTYIRSYYSEFQSQAGIVRNIIIVVTIASTALCLYFSIRFSRQISTPISELAAQVQKVAKGNWDADYPVIKTKYEINILADNIHFMIKELKQLFQKTEEKANVERQLQEQTIKNLEMANLLKSSELNFLQSQINPHFLFNTLNSISVLADIEHAAQTQHMIESMSHLLRYNITRGNAGITLQEEYDIVLHYLYIQKVRFGDRFEFVTNADEDALSAAVPSMILQPFVENSIIHGLEPKEGKGRLEINILNSPEGIQIQITDNGIGMTESQLSKILDYCGKPEKGETEAIGIRNVLRRLELFYGYRPVTITSSVGCGTLVVITLRQYPNRGTEDIVE